MLVLGTRYVDVFRSSARLSGLHFIRRHFGQTSRVPFGALRTTTPDEVSGNQTVAHMTFPFHNPYPHLTLRIPSLTQKETLTFSVPSSVTISQLFLLVREDIPSLTSLSFLRRPSSWSLSMPPGVSLSDATAKTFSTASTSTYSTDTKASTALESAWTQWASSTTMEQVLKDGFRGAGEYGHPVLWSEWNGQRIAIHLPTFSERTQEHREQLALTRKALAPLENRKKACDLQASQRAGRLMWGGFAGLITQWCFLVRATWWDSSWDVVEPFTFFITMGNSILAYAFFMVYRRNFSFEVLSSIAVSKNQMTLYEAKGLDIHDYNRLKERLEKLEVEVESILEEYQ